MPEEPMTARLTLALLATSLALAGCVSFSSSNPNPPPSSTVVVPAR